MSSHPTNRIVKNIANNLQYEIKEKIGGGTYGQVYKGVNRQTRELVALKTVTFFKEDKEGFPISTLREIKSLKALHSHPNIVDLKDIVISGEEKWYETQDKSSAVYLVFEHVPHDLSGIIYSAGDLNEEFSFDEALIKSYMYQILDAVSHVHAMGYMHRDLKASNILLKPDGTIKLADFGLAKKINDYNGRYTNRVVTRWYRAPELLLGDESYTTAIDCWAIGCILGEFMKKEPILPGTSDVDQLAKIFDLCGTPTNENWPSVTSLKKWEVMKPKKILPGKLLEVFPDFNPSVLDLLQRLLCLDPSKRITASEALNHEWFKQEPHPNKNTRLPSAPRTESYVKREKLRQQEMLLKNRPIQRPEQRSATKRTFSQAGIDAHASQIPNPRHHNSRHSRPISHHHLTTNHNGTGALREHRVSRTHPLSNHHNRHPPHHYNNNYNSNYHYHHPSHHRHHQQKHENIQPEPSAKHRKISSSLPTVVQYSQPSTNPGHERKEKYVPFIPASINQTNNNNINNSHHPPQHTSSNANNECKE